MEIQNPYLKELQDKVREYENRSPDNDGEEILKKINELEAKARDFTRQAIGSLGSDISAVREKIVEVEESTESISKQYKEACRVYKEADNLIKKIRAVKKSIRDEIAARRKSI